MYRLPCAKLRTPSTPKMSVRPLATSQMNMPDERPARQTWTIDWSMEGGGGAAGGHAGPAGVRSGERRERLRALERRPRVELLRRERRHRLHDLDRVLRVGRGGPPRHRVQRLVVLLAEHA